MCSGHNDSRCIQRKLPPSGADLSGSSQKTIVEMLKTNGPVEQDPTFHLDDNHGEIDVDLTDTRELDQLESGRDM